MCTLSYEWRTDGIRTVSTIHSARSVKVTNNINSETAVSSTLKKTVEKCSNWKALNDLRRPRNPIEVAFENKLHINFLPPPRRMCFRRCWSVCLSVCEQRCAKTSKRVFMKFSGKIGNGSRTSWLNFGGDLDRRLDNRDCFPDSILLRRMESCKAESYAAIMMSLHCYPMIARQRLHCTQRAVSPVHDIARLVREGLAEVCTVPVLGVLYMRHDILTRVACSSLQGIWQTIQFDRSDTSYYKLCSDPTQPNL